jgi:hypothetical protein
MVSSPAPRIARGLGYGKGQTLDITMNDRKHLFAREFERLWEAVKGSNVW